ncbi:MAG: FliI/YscN family ATPase [Mariprofundales bacterium]|nr:FliI/YscN family ATPase [Mariprofundales bacterium]
MPDQALWHPEARKAVLSRFAGRTPYPLRGRVHKLLGPMLEATGMTSSIGDSCDIFCSAGHTIEAEVVGFRDKRVMLMPVGATRGIAPGDPVQSRHSEAAIAVDDHLLGRVINALGQAMDGHPLKPKGVLCPLHGKRLNPCSRHLIDVPMEIGIKAMDGCLPMGWGQRLGIFAGAGVGKSSLMGMLARNTDAEINVIALVGERGREVREFLDIALGPEALKRSVVVVSTSDTPPVLRVRAALMATTIAEQFRSRGKRVLLMMDSLTRFAQAQREIGLMLGEPPTTKGFTPSCFSAIAELLERAGPDEGSGNLSAIYTVLVEGDDLAADPVADASMAILDGHIVLERRLAEQGHYPAINVLRSISRLESQLSPSNQLEAARALRKDLSLYGEMEDMINMGAYEAGSNPNLDAVIGRIDQIRQFLQQGTDEHIARADAVQQLMALYSAPTTTLA